MREPGADLARDPVYAVSELVSELRTVFAHAFGRVWVEGEVSGLYRSRIGHVYFDLKDDGGLLKCALFRRAAHSREVELTDGMLVRVRAQPDVYPERGQLQLIVDRVEPAGEGALRAALERLRVQLSAEGLFDPTHKRALPRHPRRVGVVTSLGGAAIHDLVRALRRRGADLELVVYDARVQGPEAWRGLVRGLNLLAAQDGIDLIVLARGGGSLEDLWCFNREELVRAIFCVETPVISAIGHETDFVLCDWVADARAATPTAAAELLCVDRAVAYAELNSLGLRLERLHRERLASLRSRVQGLQRGLIHPRERLRAVRHRVRACATSLRKLGERLPGPLRRRLDDASDQLDGRLARGLVRAARLRTRALAEALEGHGMRLLDAPRGRVDAGRVTLDALSPLRVLGRGYGIARRTRDGAILRASRDIRVEEDVEVVLASGWLRARVTARDEDE